MWAESAPDAGRQQRGWRVDDNDEDNDDLFPTPPLTDKGKGRAEKQEISLIGAD